MSMPRMIFQVYGFTTPFKREPVATFFESFDAETFAMHPDPERNLYVDAGRYDKRTSGYRPADTALAEYRAWVASLPEQIVDVEHLGPRDGYAGRCAA